MGIEQLGLSTQATIIAVKPPESGLARAPKNGQPGQDLSPLPVDVQTIWKAVQEVAQPDASTLEFHTDAETGKVVVKITDNATGELVRQIPMEEMLALAKSLDRLQGLLLQTKA
jgi:flagellar protein FlaG